MNRNKALVLLFFTLILYLYAAFFLCYFIGIFLSITNSIDKINNMFFMIFPVHFGIMIEAIVLLVIYIIDSFKNKNIEESQRVLWLIVLFYGNMIAMPIYWYINIWKPIKTK